MLLAGPTADTVVADTRGEDWEADRAALLARSLSLAGLLRRRGLVLRSDLLRPWARWITPVTEERRYDTRFFAAALPVRPAGQGRQREADDAAWVEPAAALAAARRKEIFLLPPTAVTLGELDSCGHLPAALTARRRITALIPEVLHGRRGGLADRPAGTGATPLSVPRRQGRDVPARDAAAHARARGSATARPRCRRVVGRQERAAAWTARAQRGRGACSPQSLPDDAGRHQHLAHRRAGVLLGAGRGPGAGRTSGTCAASATWSPPPGSGWARSCSRTGTPTTPRARPRSRP